MYIYIYIPFLSPQNIMPITAKSTNFALLYRSSIRTERRQSSRIRESDKGSGMSRNQTRRTHQRQQGQVRRNLRTGRHDREMFCNDLDLERSTQCNKAPVASNDLIFVFQNECLNGCSMGESPQTTNCKNAKPHKGNSCWSNSA